VRSEPRVAAALPIRIEREDGSIIEGTTQDFSQKGLGFRVPPEMNIPQGERIKVTLFRKWQTSEFPATVMFSRGGLLGAQFDRLSLRQQSELVRLTFSRADIWASSWGSRQADTPLAALREVSCIGMRGMRELFR